MSVSKIGRRQRRIVTILVSASRGSGRAVASRANGEKVVAVRTVVYIDKVTRPGGRSLARIGGKVGELSVPVGGRRWQPCQNSSPYRARGRQGSHAAASLAGTMGCIAVLPCHVAPGVWQG